MRLPTRWESESRPGHSERYVERFRQLASEGADLAGEARLVDAVVGPRSRILDAGCGTGRVGAALWSRGHRVVGVDADPVLLAAAQADHPGPEWLLGDLAELDLSADPFDAAVCAGNVLVYVAPGTERRVLGGIAGHLRPDGLLISGFTVGPAYLPERLDEDAAAVGLTLEQRFSTWDLRPWREDSGWVVSLHRRVG